MNMCNAFFCLVTIFVMFRWKDLNGRAGATAVGVLYTCAIMYGTMFMSGKLMTKHGMNLLAINNLANSTNAATAVNSTAGSGLSFDPTPMVITLTGQAGILAFGLLSPLRHR